MELLYPKTLKVSDIQGTTARALIRGRATSVQELQCP